MARWTRAAGNAWSATLDLMFPPVCVSCLGLVEREEPATDAGFRHLCEGCRRRITLVTSPHCTTCGYPFFGVVSENTGCPHCATLQPAFCEGRTATLLQGPVRSLVHALKYENATHVLHDIEALVRANDYFRAFFKGAILVPVPLHPRKRRARGYNQAELLAEVLVRHVDGAEILPLLRRVVFTQTQTRLDRAARQENLRNAFALDPRARVQTGRRYVLVDDVFTTGATLNACARVLRRAGLTAIDVATLGHG